MSLRLFLVERITPKMTKAYRPTGYVYFDEYVVLAASSDEAKRLAVAHNPRDIFDGPTVEWKVEEEDSFVVKTRSGTRRSG